MSKIVPTNHFKKQFKKIKRNHRWHRIFTSKVPFENDNRSPWDYIMDCFLEDSPIPNYFYEHPITLSSQQKQNIRNRLGTDTNIEILGLDLHFDGHNGDHLLLYVKTNVGLIYLINIGTHSDLFK